MEGRVCMDCKYCGSSGFYLESKGTHTGLYCRSCGKWLKWVGKKELDMYKKSGVIVHSTEGNESKNTNVVSNTKVNKKVEDCPTCLSHSLEEIEKIDKTLQVGIKDNVLGVFLGGTPLGFYSLNYCPSCGKKLN